VLIGLQFFRKRSFQALTLCGKLFTLGWPVSFRLAVGCVRGIYGKASTRESAREQVFKALISSVQPLAHTRKFFDDPSLMLKASAIVLKSPTVHNKGVIVLKYSYYFPLFLKFFDVNAVVAKYHLVLEPSWAGLCETGILSYALYGQPVFVMAYEPLWDRPPLDRQLHCGA
jgi:hypothetical protein